MTVDVYNLVFDNLGQITLDIIDWVDDTFHHLLLLPLQLVVSLQSSSLLQVLLGRWMFVYGLVLADYLLMTSLGQLGLVTLTSDLAHFILRRDHCAN
jgi:hypothetical protein